MKHTIFRFLLVFTVSAGLTIQSARAQDDWWDSWPTEDPAIYTDPPAEEPPAEPSSEEVPPSETPGEEAPAEEPVETPEENSFPSEAPPEESTSGEPAADQPPAEEPPPSEPPPEEPPIDEEPWEEPPAEDMPPEPAPETPVDPTAPTDSGTGDAPSVDNTTPQPPDESTPSDSGSTTPPDNTSTPPADSGTSTENATSPATETNTSYGTTDQSTTTASSTPSGFSWGGAITLVGSEGPDPTNELGSFGTATYQNTSTQPIVVAIIPMQQGPQGGPMQDITTARTITLQPGETFTTTTLDPRLYGGSVMTEGIYVTTPTTTSTSVTSTDEWGPWIYSDSWNGKVYGPTSWSDWQAGSVVWGPWEAGTPTWGDWETGVPSWGGWQAGTSTWGVWQSGAPSWSDWQTGATTWGGWQAGPGSRTYTSFTSWTPDSTIAPPDTPVQQNRTAYFTDTATLTRSGSVTSTRTGSVQSIRSGSITQTRSGSVTSTRSGSITSTRSGSVTASRSGEAPWTQDGTRTWSRSGTRYYSDGTSESLAETGAPEPISASGTDPVSETKTETINDSNTTPLSDSQTSTLTDSRTDQLSESRTDTLSESRTENVTDSSTASSSGSETQNQTVDGTGTTWAAFDELARDWYPTGSWSPDPITIPNSQAFTQSRPEAQDRRKGERSTSGEERNIELYTLTRIASQAAFGTLTYTLITASSGPGSVTAGGTYNPNSSLTITASTSASRFLGWSGDAIGTSNPLLVTMDRNKALTGLFAAKLEQSISFAPASMVRLGGTGLTSLPLSATASSGLPVSFVLVSGPATLAGTILTVTGSGPVVVQAVQPGDATYAAATPITRSINSVTGATLKQLNRDNKIQSKEAGGANLVREK